MKLANEPIMVRAFVGALLGLLVNFGVKLSGVQVESILALTDAVLPLVFALLGSMSARWKVDGPVTAAKKDDLIVNGILEVPEPPKNPNPRRRTTLASLVFLAALPLLSGCAWLSSVPITADALIAAIKVAQRAVHRFRIWVEQAPGLPVEVVDKVLALLDRGTTLLLEAEQLARQGEAMRDQGVETYESGSALVHEVVGLLQELGWGRTGDRALPPAGRAAGDASPVELPPRALQ